VETTSFCTPSQDSSPYPGVKELSGLPVGGSCPLLLDLYTNNSHQIYLDATESTVCDDSGGHHDAQIRDDRRHGTRSDYCSAPVGVFQGVQVLPDGNARGVRSAMRCKRWSCPYCRDVNLRILRKRVFNGAMAAAGTVNGFRERYLHKLLTLTYGGNAKRAGSDPLSAYTEMCQAFEKLIKALKKRRGRFYYLRVVETHKDGWPHFHVLLVGNAIAGREVHAEISRLWRDVYGLGFIKLNEVKNFEHAVRYITKYLTKDLAPIGKGKRVYSASKGALVPAVRRTWYHSRVWLGLVDDRLKDGHVEMEVDLDRALEIPRVVRDALSPNLYAELVEEKEVRQLVEIWEELQK